MFNRIILLLSLLCIVAPGCAPRPRLSVADPSIPAAQQIHRIYLVHLPGIGGPARTDDWMIEGLRDGGLEMEFLIYNWIGQDFGIRSLVRYEKNHQLAKELAERIVAIRASHPNEPIIVSAHSGGNGMLLWALENLPDGMQVEAALMLSPAVSPDYDLTNALKHCKRMYSFHSKFDGYILGAGTRIFGTMDGKKTDAAGLVGFTRPETADADQYAKFQQFSYDPAWQPFGNFGAHIDNMRKPFAREILAPLLKTGKIPTSQPPITMSRDESNPAVH